MCMTARACPNCRQPLQPGDDICENCGAAPAPTSRLNVGRVLNHKYKITKAIGSGGMGAVYLAEDQILKRPVVIKVLLSSDDPDLATQSVKEREFLAAIKHANIVAIYDFFTVDTEGYIVMEYIQGKTAMANDPNRIVDAETLSTGASNQAFGTFTDTIDRLSDANRTYYNRFYDDTDAALSRETLL